MEPENRKSNYQIKQEMQQTHGTRFQVHGKCRHVIDIDDSSTTTTTTTTTVTNSIRKKKNYKNSYRPRMINARVIDDFEKEWQNREKGNGKNNYDDDVRNEDEDEDADENEAGDKDVDNADMDNYANEEQCILSRLHLNMSTCRHCLLLQSELTSRQIPGVRLRKSQSKSRQRKRSRSKQRHHQNFNHSGVMPRWPELNVANEQAIRFRCPQVGPLVGRDLHTPQPMHFHHPQQLCGAGPAQLKALTQSQVVHKPTKSKYKRKHRHNKSIAANGTTASSIANAVAQPAALQPPPPPLIAFVALESNSSPSQGTTEQASIQGSPSLVTVSTWYTVAKQGVSC